MRLSDKRESWCLLVRDNTEEGAVVALLRRKLALEMAFNIFTTKRVSCFGQYDRIDDLITFKLRGDKRPVFRQFLVDEFHSSVVFKCFDPLLVWHVRGLYLRCPYAFSKRPRL